jgi:hypothetical protein
MEISIQPSTPILKVGDTTRIDVYLNTGNKNINVIEGAVKVSGDYEMVYITTTGSPLSLWPNKPSYEKNQISFTGGIPQGIQSNAVQVFSMYIKPKKTGSISVTFTNTHAYINDGSGTEVAVTGVGSKIAVAKQGKTITNEFSTFLSTDTTPPEPFVIELGKDPATFDGKYFVSFLAQDNQSGINRYEVRENGGPFVRSGSTYVLKDQTLKGSIEVHAIDNAGNDRVETYTVPTRSYTPWIAGVVVVVIVFFILRKLIGNKTPHEPRTSDSI